MRTIAQIYQALNNGDTLTDAELKAGTEHFATLANMAALSGPEFAIVKREAMRTYNRLNDFQLARAR